ncbi:MAG: hypothetical protein B6245_21900 [Desulfobacteraceae bacterium 4572_88]|nr:MAG: hypothetical protein B6245_21900 [Desulfobacteraceae bacterium 4572_88]
MNTLSPDIRDAKRPGCIPTQACPELAEGAWERMSCKLRLAVAQEAELPRPGSQAGAWEPEQMVGYAAPRPPYELGKNALSRLCWMQKTAPLNFCTPLRTFMG